MAPDLFKYHDYRQYIRDLLNHYKSTKSGPSLRGLAQELGVKAPYLSYVLKGLRPLSDKTRDKLFDFLGFDEDQKSYFQLVAIISDSQDVIERKNAFDKLQEFRQYRKLNPNETEVYRYLTAWYYPAIREMVQLPGFQLDPKWIQERLSHPVSLDDVTKAVSFLLKNGFIEKDSSGKAVLPQKRVECTEGVYKMALGSFHRELLKIAGESIDRIPREQRHIFGQMMPLPASKIPEVAGLLEECLKKISEISREAQSTDTIYHVGFMSFPVAKT